MNQFSRYGFAAIVVTCLLALIIGLFPRIELKSGLGSDQSLSLEHGVETQERSTDLTSDEVYDLYVGPEAPTRDVKKPPPPEWPQSPHESRKEEAAPLPLDINETFEQNNLEPFKVISFRDPVSKCESHGRIAPTVPPRFTQGNYSRFTQGNYSGYCTVRFDVTSEGQTYNIETLKCSSDQLESATIKSVKKWKYCPKVVDGKAVTRTGIESKIRFDLIDENGVKLPLPEGF